jgi:hypothetical protein
MLHFLAGSCAVSWVVAAVFALRWHHVLTSGSQGDFDESLSEEMSEEIMGGRRSLSGFIPRLVFVRRAALVRTAAFARSGRSDDGRKPYSYASASIGSF